MSTLKMVIVMRRDLKMRRGKEIAQGAHAALMFLRKHMDRGLTLTELDWLFGDMTKVCVKVDSEEEMLAVHAHAREAGIQSHVVVDGGYTEFHGVKTPTCCAIGPDTVERVDAITGHLALY